MYAHTHTHNNNKKNYKKSKILSEISYFVGAMTFRTSPIGITTVSIMRQENNKKWDTHNNITISK
jgi:hypothetical protein